MAEQGFAPDALQRPLVPRSRFRRRRCSPASGSRRRIMPRFPTPRPAPHQRAGDTCTDLRAVDGSPVPRTQANSPHEEREVSVPGQRWGTTHAVPLLLITSGHRAGDGTWEPRPSRSRQVLHERRGSASLPLSPTVRVYFPGSSRSILPHTTHRQPVLPLGNCSTINGHWALHSIQPCVGGELSCRQPHI